MARTVDDLGVLLSVMVGHDPLDRFTAITAARTRGDSYHPLTGPEDRAWRVGIVEDAFGSDDDSDSGAVNTVIRNAIHELERAGIDAYAGIRLPDLGGLDRIDLGVHEGLTIGHHTIPIASAKCASQQL